MMEAYRFSQIAVAALQKAIDIDGEDLDARFALMRFYLHAPPIAGGDAAKALEQADAIAR